MKTSLGRECRHFLDFLSSFPPFFFTCGRRYKCCIAAHEFTKRRFPCIPIPVPGPTRLLPVEPTATFADEPAASADCAAAVVA
jgi:hypothetical protein